MTTKTTQKIQAAIELADEQFRLERELASVVRRQNEEVLGRIQSLQQVGLSVTRKVLADRYWDQAAAALYSYSWIRASLSFKRFSSQGIIFEASRYSGGTAKPEEVELPYKYLSMSDREFAKLIRNRVWAWKNHQKQTAAAKLREETEKNISKLKLEISKNEQQMKAAAKELKRLQAREG